MHFAYSQSWLSDPESPPLSQAMPKTDAPFADRICKAVFGGLRPEKGQRTAIARALGFSPDNPFRLLEALGGDVAGALAFLPRGQKPTDTKMLEPPFAFSDEELSRLLERLPRDPHWGSGPSVRCLFWRRLFFSLSPASTYGTDLRQPGLPVEPKGGFGRMILVGAK